MLLENVVVFLGDEVLYSNVDDVEVSPQIDYIIDTKRVCTNSH